MIYNLGHAVFEFIEARWGKKGLQDYILALRKSVIGGGEDAFREAFNLKDEEFDQQFEKYLKDRFKAVPRQGAVGRLRAQPRAEPEQSPFSNALSAEPSPVGRADRGRHRQPQGSGSRHRARLGARRPRSSTAT